MALRVVYFGNSQSVFSNRHFQALVDTPCELVAVVDVPPSWRTSTNPAAGAFSSFVQVARQRGVQVLEPSSPNLPEFVEAMRRLSPDLLLAVGYSQVLRRADPVSPPPPARQLSRLTASRVPGQASRILGAAQWRALGRPDGPRYGCRSGLPVISSTRCGCEPGRRIRWPRCMTGSWIKAWNWLGCWSRMPRKGHWQLRPQPEDGASYYSSVDEDDFRLDWTRDAEELRRWIQITPGKMLLRHERLTCLFHGCSGGWATGRRAPRHLDPTG